MKKKWSSSKQVIYVNKLKKIIIYDEVWEKEEMFPKTKKFKKLHKSEDEKELKKKKSK